MKSWFAAQQSEPSVSELSFKQITTKYRFHISVAHLSDLFNEWDTAFSVENADLSFLGIHIGDPLTAG